MIGYNRSQDCWSRAVISLHSRSRCQCRYMLSRSLQWQWSHSRSSASPPFIPHLSLFSEQSRVIRGLTAYRYGSSFHPDITTSFNSCKWQFWNIFSITYIATIKLACREDYRGRKQQLHARRKAFRRRRSGDRKLHGKRCGAHCSRDDHSSEGK